MKRYNNLQVEKQKQLQIVFKTKSSSQLFVATAVMTVKHQVFIVIHSSIYTYKSCSEEIQMFVSYRRNK